MKIYNHKELSSPSLGGGWGEAKGEELKEKIKANFEII
ncbi:hypothetical protein BH23BAC2_BH23BAC2_25570 [soil metagenome]